MKRLITWTRSHMGDQSGWTPLGDIDIWHEFGRYQVEIYNIAGPRLRANEGFRTQREAREWAEARVRERVRELLA